MATIALKGFQRKRAMLFMFNYSYELKSLYISSNDTCHRYFSDNLSKWKEFKGKEIDIHAQFSCKWIFVKINEGDFDLLLICEQSCKYNPWSVAGNTETCIVHTPANAVWKQLPLLLAYTFCLYVGFCYDEMCVRFYKNSSTYEYLFKYYKKREDVYTRSYA